MKKILLFSCILIMVPYLIVSILESHEKINFEYYSNSFVRVKQSDNNIVSVPFEDYIVGVLAGEMPVSFHKEALKAQAVAARSYCLKKMFQNADKEYDVVDTTANQVYLDEEHLKSVWKADYDKQISILKEVVNETQGEYLEYDGEVIEAFFFSTSTGKTENSEEVFGSKLPYLRSVDSTWDEISPVFTETKTFPLGKVAQLLNIELSTELNINIKEKTTTGRVKTIVINSKTFKGEDFRTLLGLRSNYFTINQTGNNITIVTKGYGHGVGMSQYGAYGMALEGYNYQQILKHYYKGVEIQKL